MGFIIYVQVKYTMTISEGWEDELNKIIQLKDFYVTYKVV